MDARCRVELFGGLRLVRDPLTVTRFRTHNTASLLAILALELPRAHSREELIELFWPEAESEPGRAYLRTTLSYLRRLLEPPGVPYNNVLIADRSTVRLESNAFTTDVGEFTAIRENARGAQDLAEEMRLLRAAVHLYTGDLLCGFYDDWALAARQQFADAYVHTLRRLVRLLAEAKDYSSAIEYAQRILQTNPLDERAVSALMRLYGASGAANHAIGLYDDFTQRMRDEIGAPPSAGLAELAAKLRPLARAPLCSGADKPDLADLAEVAIPAPSTRDSTPSFRIPLIPTTFFGRDEELATLKPLLCDWAADRSSARLVTLTGPGGVGKTRLAVEAGRRMNDSFGSAVCFVQLADVSEPGRIAPTVAAALRLPPIQSEDRFDQVAEFLRRRPSLLILDNLEQLVEGGAEVISALLRAVPGLTCLVTSRRSLEVEGEQELPVGPLPPPVSAESPEQLLECPSVQLFSDRAQKVRPEFQITANNAADVATVVRRLEGIPLALELAAARSRTLTPKQMSKYLADGLEVLVNRRAGKDERHRSLWAAIEWSYRLLTPALRRAFVRLSVFESGWSLDAANAVLEDCDAADSLDQLSVDSLIVAEEIDGEMRYRMLNTIREFASARLRPDDRAIATGRHAAHFAELAKAAIGALKGSDQARWLALLDLDLDNIRAAFHYCAEFPNANGDGLRLVSGMWRYWIQRGLVNEGLALSRRIVELPVTTTAGAIYVDALNSTGGLALAVDDYALCVSLHQEAVRAAEDCGYVYGRGAALDDWGCAEVRRGNYAAARDLLEESVAMHRKLDNENGIANALTHLGVALLKMEAFEEAERVCEEAVDRFRRLGDRLQLAITLSNLGMIADRRGDSERARVLYLESLEIHRSLGNRSGAALTLGNLGVMARSDGDFETARRHLVESLATFKELGMRRAEGLALTELGKTEEKIGEFEAARDLHVQSLAVQRAVGAKDGVITALINLGRVRVRLGSACEAAPCLSEALDLSMESGLLLTAASVLDQFAALALSVDRPYEAARFLGAADKLRESSPAQPCEPEREEVESATRAALGEMDYCDIGSCARGAPIEDSVRMAHSLLH